MIGSENADGYIRGIGRLSGNRATMMRSEKKLALNLKRSRQLGGHCSPAGGRGVDRPTLISKIHHLLQIHSAQRVRNELHRSICSHRLHKAFYRAIRLCFEQQIFESKLFPVGELFLELYLCEGTLPAIFSILSGHVMCDPSFTHNGNNILYPGAVDDNMEAFEYYLHHVSLLKNEEFCEAAGKPLDIINRPVSYGAHMTPLLAAVSEKNPQVVLALLRYGADPFLSLGSSEEDRTPDPVEQLLNELHGIFLFRNTAFSVRTKEALTVEEGKVLTCLQMVRRAVSHIPLDVSDHVNTCLSEEVPEVFLGSKRNYPIQPNLASSLDLAAYNSPKLQQLCRKTVRAHLAHAQSTKQSLPRSIGLLPLPKLLKQYIDLLID